MTGVDSCSISPEQQYCVTVQDGKWVINWVKEFSDSAALERLMEDE